MTIRWYGLLAPEEAPTGDGRMFAEQALTYRDFPLRAAWQRTSGRGHDGAVVVGSWNGQYQGQGGVWGAGEFLDPTIVPEVIEAVYLLEKRLIGPSVDLDPRPLAYEIVEHPNDPEDVAMKITRGNVNGVTFVMSPAFPQVHITVDTEEEMTILASAGITSATFTVDSTSWNKFPLAPRETKFDFETAENNIAIWSGGDAKKFSSGYLWRDPDGDPNSRETYRLPIIDIFDGKPYLVPRAVFSAGVIMSGGHGGLYDVLDEQQRTEVQEVITDIYDMLRQEYSDPRVVAPWQRGGRQGATSADAEPDRSASLRSTDHMDGDSIMTWAQKAVASRAETAEKTSTGEAPWRGGFAEPASTGESELACRCQTSPVTIAASSSNPSVASEKKFDALHVRTPEISTFAESTHDSATETTSITASGTSRLQLNLDEHPQVGDGSEPPTGETSSASPNFSGNTSSSSTSSNPVVASSVASLSNSGQENWARFGLHTSTTAMPLGESGASSAPLATEGSGPSGMIPISLSAPSATYATELRALTSPMPTSLTAASGKVAVPLRPPTAWFGDPKLKGPTPITVTEDGRVFGTLAPFGQCHLGVGNKCTMAPRSATGYAHFKQGTVLTAEGSSIRVGKITIGTGHADERFGVIPAREHYDDTGTCVAVVNAGEDSFGVWVAGALVDGVSDRTIAELRRSPLSGDWRRVNGNLELIGALAVNYPGFPILHEDVDGHYSLVAGGFPQPDGGVDQPELGSGGEVGDPVGFGAVDSFLSQMSRVERAAAISQAFQDLLPPQEGCDCHL